MCEACGFPSYNGRVCGGCIKFWGGPVENVLAAVALRRRFDGVKTFDEIAVILGEVCDYIVPDWPGVSLPALFYTKENDHV